MKNFRKVLALVLVVATLFSFASVAGAYTDDAAIAVDYSDAVGVLSAIGILNGYEDGSFKPASTIDRDEMAKMVAVLANAGDDSVHAVYEGACNFADTTSNWAKSYIGYCAHTGIIAGRSATTFDPNGKVTGLETAKMLLVVLGFNAEKQGYVGSNWKVNVIRDAKNFGLLDNFAADFDATKAITREQAAQMFMNALLCNVVIGTLSDNIIDISNASYNNLKNLNGMNWTLIDAEKYGLTLVYGNVLISNTQLLSIYNGLTAKRDVDCFGRPGTTWSYVDPVTKATKTIGFFADKAVKTYTAKAAVATDFKSQIASADYTKVAYVNGINFGADVAAVVNAETGNGTLTEVYITPVAQKEDGTWTYELRTVSIQTFIAKVANYNRITKEFVLKNANDEVISGTLKSSAVANGDMVLFNICNATKQNGIGVYDATHYVHSVKVVKPVATAKVTYGRDTQNINTSYFLAGEKYYYNHNFGVKYAADEAAVMTGLANNGKTYAIYEDNYGYAMLVTAPAPGAAAAAEYAVVTNATHKLTGEYIDVNGNKADLHDDSATMYVYDGVAGVVEGATYAADHEMYNAVAAAVGAQKDAGLLVRYYTVDGVAEYDDKGLTVAPGVKLGKGSWKLTDSIYADSDTLFMIRTTNPATGAKTYTEVVGYQNLDKDYISGTDITMQYFANGNWAEVVFIDALYTTEATEFIVLGNLQWDAFDADVKAVYAGDYNAYRVLVGGEEAIILTVASGLKANTVYTCDTIYLGTALTNDVEGKTLPLYTAEKVEKAATPLAGQPTIHKDSKGELWITINGATQKLAADFRYLLVGSDLSNTDAFVGYTDITEDIKTYVEVADYVAGNGAVYVFTSGGAVTLVYEVPVALAE